MEDLGQNLIFLISLPRSGSTLLQHILAGHSTVEATAEPWVLFPSALALRQGALEADYRGPAGQVALTEFVARLDGGKERYYAAVRKMALELYNAYLANTRGTKFLDKTSRYYLILPEMYRIFPRASYVFLVRNPLAVFASFLDKMVFGDWRRLGEPGIRNDLLDGYRLVREGIRFFGDDAIVVRYEDLAESPAPVVVQLCQQLGLRFEPEMLQYGDRVGVLPGRLVDPKSIQKHRTAVSDYVDAWRSRLTTRQERRFAQAFLAHLGEDLVSSLGYPYGELRAAMAGDGTGRAPTVSWSLLMTLPERRTALQSWWVQAVFDWQERGLVSPLKRIGKRIVRPVARLGRQMRRRLRKNSRHTASPGGRSAQDRSAANSYRPNGGGSEYRQASSAYRVVTDPSRMPPSLLRGWQAPSVASRQLAAYRSLLEKMYAGNPRRDFVVAAQALRLTELTNPAVLEIGCGNGYYSEVFSFLTGRSIRYSGLDYSQAMIRSAQAQYPDLQFFVADATELPLSDRSFDIAWSGTVLMHLMDYERAIAETCRVAARFCVFHSTPVVTGQDTTYLSKKAYGTQVPEVIVGQAEFEHLLHVNGLVIRHILESLAYQAGARVGGTVHTLTYVCERA